MKIKVLTVFALVGFLFMVGCRGSANTNVANGNTTNTNSMANSMANSMTNTMTAPANDSVAATAVRDAMQKAGLKDVTVTATTAEVILRGSVPKGKLGEAVRIATETGKRKVDNQLTEK
jgi:osmotically-inducible protein OsmY